VLGYRVMKTPPVRTFLLLMVLGGIAAIPLVGCENKGNAPPAASPADASSGAAATAPSSAPAPKTGGGGW
jgi:hypothetical protein